MGGNATDGHVVIACFDTKRLIFLKRLNVLVAFVALTSELLTITFCTTTEGGIGGSGNPQWSFFFNGDALQASRSTGNVGF